jgi:hypothetical protein
MSSWDDVRALALALPETSEQTRRGNLSWLVKTKGFVWERPLNRSDLKRQQLAGLPVPEGPILAARVADLGVREALIADDPEVYFTIAHFEGFPAVLLLLERIGADELREVVTDAWLACAPPKLAAQYLAENPLR